MPAKKSLVLAIFTCKQALVNFTAEISCVWLCVVTSHEKISSAFFTDHLRVTVMRNATATTVTDLPLHPLVSMIIRSMAHQVVTHTTGGPNITPIIPHDPLQGMLLILSITLLIHITILTITHHIVSPLLHILVGRTLTSPLITT